MKEPRGVIPESWPAEDIIDILVDKSSGCFIYPATVIKHIDNPRRNPVGLLDEVMALIKPLARVNPLAELDALYNHILRPPDTDMALVTRILNCIMVLHQTPSPPDPTGPFLSVIYTPAFIDLFLLLPRGEVAMAMCELHSVIRIPSAEEDEAVNFFHKTLADFLISPERSGDLHCPLYRTHLDFSSSCVYHIQSTVRRSDITTRHVLQYAHWNWGGHLARAFQESPKEARHMLPLSIEKFDPVQSWKYQVNQIQAPLIFDEREKIHSMICEQSGNCVELCVKAIQTERWSKEFETFYAQSVQEDVVNRKAWVTRRTIPDGAEVDIPVPTQVFRERFATFVKMLEGRAKKSKSSSALADPTQGKSSSSSQAPPPQVSPGKHIPSLIRRITEASPPVTSESAVAELVLWVPRRRDSNMLSFPPGAPWSTYRTLAASCSAPRPVPSPDVFHPLPHFSTKLTTIHVDKQQVPMARPSAMTRTMSNLSFQLPDLVALTSSFPFRINKNCKLATDRSEAWLMDGESVGPGAPALLDEEKRALHSMKYGLLASLCCPAADAPQLKILTDFWSLAFISHARILQGYGHGWPSDVDVENAEDGLELLALNEVFKSLVPAFKNALSPRPPDIQSRWKRQFTRSAKAFATSQIQLRNDLQTEIVPSVLEYMALRRESYGSSIFVDLLELLEIASRPYGCSSKDAEKIDQVTMWAMHIVGWILDVFSFASSPSDSPFPMKIHQPSHNLISLLTTHKNLSVQGAMNYAGGMVKEALEEIQRLERELMASSPGSPGVGEGQGWTEWLGSGIGIVKNAVGMGDAQSPLMTSKFLADVPIDWDGRSYDDLDGVMNCSPEQRATETARFLRAMKEWIVGTVHWGYESELYFGQKGDEVRSFGWVFLSGGSNQGHGSS
ncbi:hypothetical protein NMY22_g13330 [Coprinellus aureogranulatus]|nr:hypothetical protein NMY22_g13330 [Coprinellus aureogranulatus]